MGSQVLGGCFTIMMCKVFGESFWRVGGGSGGMLSNECLRLWREL